MLYVKGFFVMILLAAASGCAGDGTLEEVDPEAAPMAPTYSEHVSRIMELRCTACHAVDAQPGEEHGYGYETCEKVKRNWRSLVNTSIDGASMPPAGADRVTSSEKLTLLRWRAQGSTCD